MHATKDKRNFVFLLATDSIIIQEIKRRILQGNISRFNPTSKKCLNRLLKFKRFVASFSVIKLCKCKENEDRHISCFVPPPYRRSAIYRTFQRHVKNDNSTWYRSFRAISCRYNFPAKCHDSHFSLIESCDIITIYRSGGKLPTGSPAARDRHPQLYL